MASEPHSVQGLTPEEFAELEPIINKYHIFEPSPNTCTSIITYRIDAPASTVWPFVRSFENPQKYKHFIKGCNMRGDGGVGSIREVTVVSGIPASTSTERLEILDDDKTHTQLSSCWRRAPTPKLSFCYFINEFNRMLNLQKLGVVAMAQGQQQQ
ncbi:START-like domain superfamily [Sesbania bispinosa]|nr:START-like domain superfamily [Sesbania bispinosa]